MAASASASLASTKPFCQWKHDVFLSFRGEDTRKGIVSYLYKELQKRGVQTFMDDQGLQQGMLISPSLLSAINESRCAIVILSPNYASSTWCLDELINILECSKAKKTMVLPIFYNVDPSDVRKQSGSFEEAFTKHEENFKQGNDSVEKVKKWRHALTTAANIAGFDSTKYGSDIELVQRIVELVCSEVRPISVISNDGFDAFEATRQAMVELMNALNEKEITTIGVYGMGGVGKTTMVKHVGAEAQIKGLFDHVIMAVVSQTPNTRNIQGALADMLGFVFQEESDNGRAGRLQMEILRRTKMLIILDDIWKRLDLLSIGIPSYNELQIRNSKVLLTTRRLNVCHTMDSQANIHLSILSEEDAWKFFVKKARKSFQRSTEFYEVARNISRECAGLPIALIAVARALGDKDFEDWKEAARRLKRSRSVNLDDEKDVFECIKLSYDFLNNDDAKSCFLLCSLFPEDFDIPIEDLMRYGFGKGLFRDVDSTIENVRAEAISVTKNLKASCLLLDGTKKGCVRMHDVIRDIAITIGRMAHAYLVQTHYDLKDWLTDAHEGYSAISLIESNICKLPNKLVCPKLQILLLGRNYDIGKIPATFFQSPNDLRLLDLSKTNISLLPSSFGLLTRLQVLYLDHCKNIVDLSMLGKLKKLEILSMRGCSSIKKFPEEIGNLTNLKMLDLTQTSFRTVLSRVISRLQRLEELHMNSYFGEWGEVEGGFKNAGFKDLIDLKRLNTLKVAVSDAKCLPQHVGFLPNWVNFYICIWKDQSRFGWIDFSHHSSRTLITESTMNDFPNWFITVVTEKTEELVYKYCLCLTNLVEEHDRGRLHGLKYLFIENSNAKVLMNTITWPRGSNQPVFEKLEELKIYKAELLEELCVGELPPGSLRSLKILNVQYCPGLVKTLLPSKLLNRLHGLELLACDNIDGLDYVFGFDEDEPPQVVLTKLRVISLDTVRSLRNIWNGPAPPGIFHSLKTFTLRCCPDLEYLFTYDVARCLLQLEELSVECCWNLDRLIEATEETESNTISLPQLNRIVLKDLPNLTRLSSSIDIKFECPSLKFFYVDKCPLISVPA